ncbi:MAG: hypothetical protein ACRCX2_36660, partial [Paraclostridium sp.]
MFLIYGIKTLSLDDILNGVSRPQEIIEFAKNNMSYIMKEVGDCSVVMQSPPIMGPRVLDFIFIPTIVINELMIKKNITDNVARTDKNTLTFESKSKIRNLLEIADEKFEELTGTNSSHDNIMKSSCLMITRDSLKDIIDVCVTVPEHIVSNADIKIKYTCSACGSTEVVNGLSGFCP